MAVILALAGAAMAGEGSPATQPAPLRESITLDLGDGASMPLVLIPPGKCPCYEARIYDPDGKLVFRGLFAWTVAMQANEEKTITFNSQSNVLPTGARPFVIPNAWQYRLTVGIGVGMGNVMDARTLTIQVADAP
jgi:hypothetical protein